MARGRTVVIGAAWSYGAQLVTILAQFIYAAITSRNVGDGGFGAYATALSVSGIIGLLANGGLGQTAARMDSLDREPLQSLLTFALLLGLGATVLLLTTADLWAALWRSPDASAAIRWCSVGAFVAPAAGLATGVLRREGRFRTLATITLAANMAGLVIGAVAVVAFRSAESLLVSPLIAQVSLALAALVSCRGSMRGLSSMRAARPYLTFSWQVTVQNLGSWVTGNVGPWSMSRAFGPGALGQWNRADVLTSVPFQQIQTAMVQAVYPEFRHDIKGPQRARRVWPDLLGLVGWFAFPLAAVAAVVSPMLVPVFFGRGWELASSLSAVLSIIAGIRMVRVLLGAAVEALGRYSWVWSAIAVQFFFTLIGVFAAAILDNYWWIFAGTGLGVLGAHLANLVCCWRAGYVDIAILCRHYAGALVFAVCLAGFVWLLASTFLLVSSTPWPRVLALSFSAVAIACVWHWRRVLPPYKLAQTYGIISPRNTLD